MIRKLRELWRCPVNRGHFCRPVDGVNKRVFEGTYEYTGGTGRFERIGGKGTCKGERIGSSKTGGDTCMDFTGTEGKK